MTQWGLDNLFNPGKRHMDDEKRRLQSTREEVGDNSGGRRIDFEGGKVSISLPRTEEPSSAETRETAGGETGSVSQTEQTPAPSLADDQGVDEAHLGEDFEPDAEVPTSSAEKRTRTDRVETADQPPSLPAGSRSLSARAWSRRG